jgi:Ca2+-binding EF-hand superfamily protein
MINKRTEELDELLSDPFSYFEGEKDVTGETPKYGSVILKEITSNRDAFITLRNFVGFKTDKRGDYGSDYFEISKREDYVSKATILEQGGIIMPTLSDKKTWLYVDGVKLPGLDYNNTVDDNGNTTPFAAEQLGDQFVISADPMSQLDNVLSQREDVVDQFISYAYSEYEAIKKADRDLDEMEKNGTKSDEVANYYKSEQGAKFSSLLGVWVNTYKKGKDGQNVVSGEKFISFNNNKKTRKKNIEEAEKYFFRADRDTQRALIARLLHKRLLQEIKTCTELGLIKRVDGTDNLFGDYENVGLNSQAIDIIYKSIVAKNG